MVALPSPAADPVPHHHREIAESFGSDAARYDRARPHYPRALAHAVLDGLPEKRVLDVGIGTGLSALPFRAEGADVVGVEVDERMAELARARGFAVGLGRFEEWDARGAAFDAVIAGQTWHWIAPDAGASKAAALLHPGGRLAIFWNAGDPDPDIAAAFGEVYRSVDTGLPFTPWAAGVSAVDGYRHFLDKATDGIRTTGAFDEPEALRFDWQATITRDAWLDSVPTMGGHNRIPADAMDALLAGLGKAVDEHGGSFTMQYATVGLAVARR
ncbi:class I SAM-dependent methyltransferase [Humibacter albus]|uniref:class I SAM-dependent methyltransferase n=1 Tax=Humibacter albus TaxID=427754 RepID=UPI0003B61038|nr:class I SAM-dependent methyltransferase [Humibacter albus]